MLRGITAPCCPPCPWWWWWWWWWWWCPCTLWRLSGDESELPPVPGELEDRGEGLEAEVEEEEEEEAPSIIKLLRTACYLHPTSANKDTVY